MDKKTRWNIILDLKKIGVMFLLPFAVTILFLLRAYLRTAFLQPIPLMRIKEIFGFAYIPLVAVWIIPLYQDFVEMDGKELILSLPYNSYEFGIFRVLKITALYTVFFYLMFFLFSSSSDSIKTYDIYLPLTTILFFSSISFAVVVFTKKMLSTYFIIGAFASFEYMTRGGFTGCIYPFQWVNPKPYASNEAVGISLLIFSLVAFFIGQIIFNQRHYLMK